MRVIAGDKKGLILKTLDGGDIVRPTTDKVKEAVFSSVQFELEHCTFLDLFAGSGQMGIEALSRGAKTAFFVDENRKSIAVCKENLTRAGYIGSGAVVIHSDCRSFLCSVDDKFDIAFLDPPYGKELINSVLPMVTQVVKPGGTIICESSVDEQLPEEAGGFSVDRIRRYGKIKITYYTQNQN